MNTDNNLDFIRQKIDIVKSAIMYSMSNDLIKLPNSIVNAVKVDDEGQLWFVCSRPALGMDYCSTSFPARLHFYRKGTFFHLEVSGRAEIVSTDYVSDGKSDQLLIRMDMSSVEYTEPTVKPKAAVDVWMEKAYGWVLRKVATSHSNKPVLSRLQSFNQS